MGGRAMPIWGWQGVEAYGEFGGMDGFLGARGSLMLDVVFLAMFLVVPVMFLSIGLAKKRHDYTTHKWIQLILGIVLLVAVVAFEVDMRINGWKHRAEASPFYVKDAWCGVWYALTIHLCFAVPTFGLWVLVIARALMLFPNPPMPGPHSKAHKFWGWLAALGMSGTAATGWIFYYLAFVAVK
jgi:putative membrane protein